MLKQSIAHHRKCTSLLWLISMLVSSPCSQAQPMTFPGSGATPEEHRAFYVESCAAPTKPLSMAQKAGCAISAEKAGIAPPGFANRFMPGAGPQPDLPVVPSRSSNEVSGQSSTARGSAVSTSPNPIGGSKIQLYTSYDETVRGHRIYGTARGLACWRQGAAHLDRAAEVFELTCPAVAIGCYLSSPSGSSIDHGKCSGNTFPVFMSRGESYIGPALVRLPLSGKASVFVFAWNQCHWNAAVVRALPEGWAAACDMSPQDLSTELNTNNSAVKLEQLHKQRWQ